MLVGNKKTLGFEIGKENGVLVEVRTFLGGVEISSDVINAYPSQFSYSIDCELANFTKAFKTDRTELFESVEESDLLKLFRCEEPKNRNLKSIENILHEHELFDHGPTHDHVTAYLVPKGNKIKIYCHYYQWDGTNNEPLSLIIVSITFEELKDTLARTAKIINSFSVKNTSVN